MTNTSTLNTVALATCQMNILVVGGGGVGDNGGGGSGRILLLVLLKKIFYKSHRHVSHLTVINPSAELPAVSSFTQARWFGQAGTYLEARWWLPQLGNMGNQAGLNCKSHPLWHPLSSYRFWVRKSWKKVLLKVLKKVKLPKKVLKADLYTQKSTQKSKFPQKSAQKRTQKRIFPQKSTQKRIITQKSGSKKLL